MAEMERYIGPAGWAYADWEGVVYPRPRRRGFDPLAYLARYVNLMEVNVTFYRVPAPSVVASWSERVSASDTFRFILKLHQGYSHYPRGIDPEVPQRSMEAAVETLSASGRLLGLLLQFPVTYRYDTRNLARIEDVRRRFDAYPLHVELRHNSWFTAAALDALGACNLGLVHLDLPTAKDHPPTRHPSLASTAYYRLHGRNSGTWFDAKAGRDARYDYRYTPPELVEIEQRLHAIESEAERSVVVMNNHYRGQAFAAALELRAALAGEAVRMPPPLVDTYPDLRRLAIPEGQQRLF